MDLAFSSTKGYPGQVKRHSLPFQVEAALRYMVVPLTFAYDCTYFQRVINQVLSRFVGHVSVLGNFREDGMGLGGIGEKV